MLLHLIFFNTVSSLSSASNSALSCPTQRNIYNIWLKKELKTTSPKDVVNISVGHHTLPNEKLSGNAIYFLPFTDNKVNKNFASKIKNKRKQQKLTRKKVKNRIIPIALKDEMGK